MRVAVLGQGAMGSRMAARLAAAGHAVTVWNRTPIAGAAPSPEAAVAGAEVVITSLRDDAASAAVWARVLPVMETGAVGIDTSTISPDAARALHRAAVDRGLPFLDAPVTGSRPQAEAGQLIFIAGGTAEVLAEADPVLRVMGAAVHHAGEAGAGAAVKLVINALFGAQLAVLAELLGLARATGLDLQRAVEIVAATPVASPALAGAAGAMLAGKFAPAFPIDLVVKDFGLALAAGKDLPVTQAVAEVYLDAKREGLGDENITAVVQRYLKR
jgi:3-hydroxyisobutyrate dehydrogenase